MPRKLWLRNLVKLETDIMNHSAKSPSGNIYVFRFRNTSLSFLFVFPSNPFSLPRIFATYLARIGVKVQASDGEPRRESQR